MFATSRTPLIACRKPHCLRALILFCLAPVVVPVDSTTGLRAQDAAAQPSSAQEPSPAPEQPPVAAAAAEPGEPEEANEKKTYRYWTTRWSFEDVDVGRLTNQLARIGITLPVEVRGDISVNLQVGVPLNGLRQAEAYRLSGSVYSSQLRLDQLQLADFSTTVEYAEGVLQLPQVSGRWRAADPAPPVTGVAGAAIAPFGQFTANTRVELIPERDLSVQIAFQELPMEPLFDLIQQLGYLPDRSLVTGRVTGQAELRTEVASIRTAENWNLSASLQSPALQLPPFPPLHFNSGAVRLQAGRLTAPEIDVYYANDPEIRLTGGLAYELTGEQRFELDVQANDLPTAEVSSLVSRVAGFTSPPEEIVDAEPPWVSGKLDLNLRGSGKLQPAQLQSMQWNVVGRVASPSFQVRGVELGLLQHELRTDQTTFRLSPIGDAPEEGWDWEMLWNQGLRIGSVAADYEIANNKIELANLDARLFGGDVSGSASLALTQSEDANHVVDLRWNNLAPQMPVLPIGRDAVRISAVTSGRIDWRVPAARWDQPLAHRGSADVSIGNLALGGTAIGAAQVQLRADGDEINASGEGTIFGGDFNFSTVAEIDARTSWQNVLQNVWRTRLQIQSAQLSSLSRLLRPRLPLGPRLPARMDGQVSLAVSVSHRYPGDEVRRDGNLPPDASPPNASSSDASPRDERLSGRTRWAGNLVLRNITIDGLAITPRLEVSARGDESLVVLDRVAGRYAGGQLSATGIWSIPPGQRQVMLRASSIDVAPALMPIWPEAAPWVGGRGSLRVTISGNETISARGALQWHQGQVMDLAVGDGHGEFDAAFTPQTGRWRVSSRRFHTTIGPGTMETSVRLTSAGRGRGFNMTSQSKARRIDFIKLFDGEGRGSFAIAKSRASGELTLGGRAISSVNDLRGRFDARLDGTNARALPGLLQTQRYLGPVSLAGVDFQEGRMRGSIGGGAVQFNELWMIDDRLRVFADGSVRLADGRMQINAVLNTGNFEAQNLLLRQFANLGSGGLTVPLDVIISVNELLSDRVLFVSLTGPLRNPRVQLKTIETLRANAVHFFLRQATRGLATSAVLAGE